MQGIHRWRVVAAGAALSLVVAGCSKAGDLAGGGSDEAKKSDSSSAPSADLKKFYAQELTWSDCGGGDQCADMMVPIDYAKPDGETLVLKARKKPAGDSDDKVGSLFINPGGPGGSGIDYLSTFASSGDDDILESYDVIGFDPRGVATSTPLKCLDDDALDDFVNVDPDPDTAAEETAYGEGAKKMGEACKSNSGELAAHVSTIEVAKDLDVMRALVGDDKLHYLGASYGTYIGSVYAEVFPKKVGRLVLDGALDPTLDSEGLNLGQAKGFQTALVAYIKSCLETDSCPLGTSEAAAQDKIKKFLDQLDATPLKTDDPERPLTQSLGFYAIALPLYNEQSWPVLTQIFDSAFAGNGEPMVKVADQYLSRTQSGYQDNSAQVIYAVNCLDKPESSTVAEVEASESEFLDVSPVFGRTFAWSPYSCSQWPIKPAEEPVTVDADGAAPIVVVGTTRDPATPYEWAQALAKQLDSGVLVSRDGDGHTGYNMGNECVDDAVNDYLLDGDVPKDGLKC